MDKDKNWMPFWLATYIFMIGLLVMNTAVDIFIMAAEEVGLEYFWHHGVLMCAAIGLPWVWYFTFIGHRYLEKIPSTYYLWIGVPFISHAYSVLSRETLYCSDIITTSDGTMYWIHIGWEVIISLAIMMVVGYEIYVHRSKYIGFLTRVKEVVNAG